METHSEKGAVVITGAGRGIGRAVALALAARGFPLVLVSRHHDTLAEVHACCARRVETRSVQADVAVEDDVKRLRPVLAQLPQLSAVVNNAGVGHWASVQDMSLEQWDEQLNVNLRGTFLVIRETLGRFREQQRGLYVNVASDCSLVGMAQRSAYNASKFGLVGLTNSLRAECARDGVHASLIFAGSTDTYFRGKVPGDRPLALRPEDVAAVVAFVVGHYPQMIIGEVAVSPITSAYLSGPRSLI